MPLLPEFLAALVIFGTAFGMAALPIFRRPNWRKTASFDHIVPHPRQPSSMVSFVALPSFLILLSLARLGVFVSLPVSEPVNGPDASSRLSGAPRGVDVDIRGDGLDATRRFSYPPNVGELTLDAARRAESASAKDRIQGVRDLAWWTGVCPNYAPFTVPRLVRALRDPDPGVKGAAAIGLGSTGGHGAPAVPDLLAVRGSTVRYFDHLVAEAVLLIEHSPRWAPASECQDALTERAERPASR